jgi:hypothetical protein
LNSLSLKANMGITLFSSFILSKLAELKYKQTVESQYF